MIVETRTAAPKVIVVILESKSFEPDGGTTYDSLQLTSGWSVSWPGNTVQPQTVSRWSIPWDEDPVIWNGSSPSYPVTTRHRIYLQMPSSFSLQNGTNYTIHTPYGDTSLSFNERSTFCESIKVNQVGYSTLGTSRFANFGVYMGDAQSPSISFSPLPTYKVYHEITGALVTSGTAGTNFNDTGNATKNSGEYVYRLNLTNVPEGGPYYVVVDGAGRSRSFGVGSTYSEKIARETMRGLYLHRCGTNLAYQYTPFAHAICHQTIYDGRSTNAQDSVAIPNPPPPTMHIEGGYHDAGDMDHTEGHPLISILMLSFFEAFPNRFVDNQYNIPESTNGIPDFLDEIMWGVKFWELMQVSNPLDPDYRGVRSGWSGQFYATYGTHDAANDQLPYGSQYVHPRITAMVAGVFAHASRLIRPYNSTRADELLSRATNAWIYVANSPNENEARTCYMYGALQLYLATGESYYHNIFQSAITRLMNGQGECDPAYCDPARGDVCPCGPWTKRQEGYEGGNNWYTCQTAHFVSYLLPTHGRSTDATLVNTLKSKILYYADNGSFMGPHPETQPYPQGFTKALGYGTGTAQGRYADSCIYGTLFTTDQTKLRNYTNAICQYADYPLGLNPMNMSYYTGLGTDQPNSPLDCNSYFTKYGTNDGVTRKPNGTLDDFRTNGVPLGNVPGICVYGPLYELDTWGYALAVEKKVAPVWDNLPGQRRYVHGHTTPRNNEFTVAETMAWNVPMYAFLYMPSGSPPPANPPAAPSNLSATAFSSSQINLNWIDNANNEAGFRIERKTGAAGTYQEIATVGPDVTSYPNTGLLPNTTYYYRVRAYNAAGNSAYSNEASATTSSTPPTSITAQRPSGTMTIDGNLSEASWSINNAVTKTIVGSPNNTVTFGVLWDDNYLYVGARVLDTSLFHDSTYPWHDDSVEIYIDGNHNKGTSYDAYDRQIVKAQNDGTIWVNGNQTAGILHASAAISGGYSVEVAIPWSNLGISPVGGTTVLGFDVACNDDDNGVDRESQVMWAGTGNNWTDTSAFGDVTLVGTNSPPNEEFTMDANTIALYHFNGDYSDWSGNGFHLTQVGNVTRFNYPGWMQSPSGQAARFSNLGDKLQISTVPDSAVEPGPSQTPLSIEARIFVRGYKAYSIDNVPIIELYQDWDSQLMLYDNKWPASGQPIGPTVNGDTYTLIVTASQWQNAVPLNTWHKFKLTFAADGTARCYINNNLIGTVATSVFVGRTSPWRITLGNFDGDIDEVRISNIVR